MSEETKSSAGGLKEASGNGNEPRERKLRARSQRTWCELEVRRERRVLGRDGLVPCS